MKEKIGKDKKLFGALLLGGVLFASLGGGDRVVRADAGGVCGGGQCDRCNGGV